MARTYNIEEDHELKRPEFKITAEGTEIRIPFGYPTPDKGNVMSLVDKVLQSDLNFEDDKFYTGFFPDGSSLLKLMTNGQGKPKVFTP